MYEQRNSTCSKVNLLSICVYFIMLRSVNSQTSVKIDICSITDFQKMTEYINNNELGIFVFEGDILID